MSKKKYYRFSVNRAGEVRFCVPAGTITSAIKGFMSQYGACVERVSLPDIKGTAYRIGDNVDGGYY